MPIAWHPSRWWNFCISKKLLYEKKELEPNCFEQCFSCISSIQYGSIGTFGPIIYIRKYLKEFST